MTAVSIADSIGRLLAAESVGDYATDRVLNEALPAITLLVPPETPDSAVTLTVYPGPEPDSRNGNEYPRLQVRVRASDALAALDLDRQAYDVLQANPGKYPAVLPDGPWTLQDCYALQTEAQSLGVDANGRCELVRNYQLQTFLT